MNALFHLFAFPVGRKALILFFAAALPIAGLAATSADVAPIIAAAKMRAELAADVSNGRASAMQALSQLRADASPRGLKLDAETEYALAAIDVGRRVLIGGKYGEAEACFKEAETILEKLVKSKTEETPAKRVQWLTELATIRVSYLDKAQEAKADFDEAIALQPDDVHLRRTRDHLGGEKGKVFGNKPAAKPEKAESTPKR